MVQVYDPTTRQYISANSFTIPPQRGIVFAVRFRPLPNNLAEANITFTIHDPTHIYSPSAIWLFGNASAPALKNISTRVRRRGGGECLDRRFHHWRKCAARNPLLDIHNADGVLLTSSNNWRSDQESASRRPGSADA